MKRHDLFAVPERNGETLFVPELSRYENEIACNMSMSRNTVVGDTKMADLALLARKEILSLAFDYTRRLGTNPAPSEPDLNAPVVASGHQPSMFHPGIALKTMALTEISKRLLANTLFISVDFDEFSAETVSAPVKRDGRLVREAHILFPQTGKTVFESAVSPDKESLLFNLRSLANQMEGDMSEKPVTALKRFIAKLETKDLPQDDFTSMAIAMRRVWLDQTTSPYEIPVSMICASESFIVYALDIIERIENFTTIFNGNLDKYRKAHKLRYKANPFPDLKSEGDWREAPFWVVTDLGRERLYVRKREGHSELRGEGGGVFSVYDLKSGGIRIRPRAITLSMFMRLFVCDYFLHGVGGAKYDSVTDAIIRDFYQITPPAYACVSASISCGIKTTPFDVSPTELREKLRDIKMRPEKVAELADYDISGLIEKKRELVVMIARQESDKKSIGLSISELNTAMGAAFANATCRLNAELEKIVELEKEAQTATARDYPFFLHDPNKIARLLNF